MNENNSILPITIASIIYDCEDPDLLAEFYAKLLGGDVGKDPYDATFVKIPGAQFQLGFQRDEFYQRPIWLGEPGDQQPMAHFDLKVDHLENAVAYALSLGATMPEAQICQPEWDVQWMMLFDPSGRPFCLFEEY